jgi:N-formylglutamate amidohydrolase
MHASFDRIGATPPAFPIIISIPHAGRDYPYDIDKYCQFPSCHLLCLEDRYADLLADHAWRAGYSGLVSRTPRAIIDLNRAEHDLDPAMLTTPAGPPALLSVKARGGLGLIPRRTAGLGELWRRRFTPTEVEARITGHHRPYHQALGALMQHAVERFGTALLLDVHSMPPLSGTSGQHPPQIVIGDRFGKSASPMLTEIACATARQAGFRVAVNAPYAGGHILDRHGRRDDGIHALQIEVDRQLYLDATLSEPGTGIDCIKALIAGLAAALSRALTNEALTIAAE